MNSSMSKVPAILGLLTLIFVTQPSFSASVKSIGRSLSVEADGQKMQQRTISCGDETLRVIFKADKSRQWCVGEAGQCFRDKLVAAKKACQESPAEINNVAAEAPVKKAELPVKKAVETKPEPVVVEPIAEPKPAPSSQVKVGLSDQRRQELLSELQTINVERQKIRVKLEQIDAQIADLLDSEKVQ